MSHVASVECLIKDLDALEKAVEAKGASFVRGQKSFEYYAGQKSKCEHAIKVPGTQYEVGVRRLPQAEEAYDMACDFYDGKISRTFGSNLMGLQNEYQLQVAEKFAEQGRYRYVREEVEGDPQAVRLRITR